MKKISIIIVTYNSSELIVDCINSIYKHNDIGTANIEIIVVDNSSEEVSLKMFTLLKEIYGKQLILIKNKENLGYGHGNNIGIKSSTGDIVCIMNPDIRLSEPIFKQTINSFEEDKKLGILGYKQIGGHNISFYLMPEYELSIATSVVTRTLNKINYFNSRFCYLSGALFFAQKSKFLQIGAFDNNMFLYFEEADVAQRMRKNGFNIKYDKSSLYVHKIDRNERNKWSYKLISVGLDSGKYYFKKFKINGKTYYKKRMLNLYVNFVLASIRRNKDGMLKYKQLIKITKDHLYNNYRNEP